VIGSAASAVQFVPEIRKTAAQVHLFQRTPNWVLPKEDTPYTEAELEAFRNDPTPLLIIRGEIEDRMNRGMTFAVEELLVQSEKYGLAAISVVEDPDVRARLTPDHPFGCKRPLLSNDYFPAFNEPNLELVTDPIERFTADAVVTVDGVERQVDMIVLATGFAATQFAATVDITGREGLAIAAAWSEGAQAYLGVTTVGFPNFFMLYGPNMNNGSIIRMLEYQTEHVIGLLDGMRSRGLRSVEVRPEAMEAYNVEVQEAIDRIDVWNAECNGYYRAPNGRVVTQWPFSMEQYRDWSATIDWSKFLTS
jgi:cation diffusion facilitator CzcD-associated flavoprotein CzcO